METIVDRLEGWALRHPRKDAFIFVREGRDDIERISYAELLDLVRKIGAHLGHRLGAQSRVLLLLNPGLDYVATFLGCIHGDVVPIPAYPPQNPRHLERLIKLIENAEASAAVLASDLVARIGGFQNADHFLGALPIFDFAGLTARDQIDIGGGDVRARGECDGIAFLQYTSGSTGDPKGVMVSHANLLANLTAMSNIIGASEADRSVFWLPPYHDFGLIGGILGPVFSGQTCILTQPAYFLRNPLRWLRLVCDYGATITGAPNFAFDLCAEKANPEHIQDLDLSSLRVTANGAEPIRFDTLDRFKRAFAPAGFNPESFVSAYGLAESTLMVACRGALKDTSPIFKDVSRRKLAENIVCPPDDEKDRTRIVNCGRVIPGHELKVVNPKTHEECKSREIGEVWVRGPSVAKGYWDNPEATAAKFDCGLPAQERRFLRTGDLGFTEDADLYVCGRLSDLIVLRGRNYYPQDIERVSEDSHEDLRRHASAAFVVERDARSWLVVAQEIEYRRRPDASKVCMSIMRRLLDEFDLVEVGAIVLVKPGGLPKTSSGKIQRRQCCQHYSEGMLNEVGRWENRRFAVHRIIPSAHVQPRNDTEERLMRLVAEALALESVGVEDDFFEIGGHSLLAIQLARRIKEEFGVDLALQEVFSNPTVTAVAGVIEAGLSKRQAFSLAGDGNSGPQEITAS